jgi:hypothetical protein
VTNLQADKIVAVLVASYATHLQRMSADALDALRVAYRTGIVDLDEQLAATAMERLRATSHLMPSIAAIRAAALESSVGAARAGGDAWGDVTRAIRRWGMNRAPGTDFEFSDPLVARCVTALGWRELCESEMHAADRARFIELYDKLAVQCLRDRVSPRALPPAPSGTTVLVASVARALTGGAP